MTLAYRAMQFAREVHKYQRRKYTGNPYTDHLAEVAGIVATVVDGFGAFQIQAAAIAVAWLHDCVEDQGISLQTIEDQFGSLVAIGVSGLSDLETGNRAERKEASRARLAACSGWIQTIKVADIISNTSSIIKHDPKFARGYLEEKRLLLDVLTKADPRLVAIARDQAERQPPVDAPEHSLDDINAARDLLRLGHITPDDVRVRYGLEPLRDRISQAGVAAAKGPGHEVTSLDAVGTSGGKAAIATRPAHGGYPDPAPVEARANTVAGFNTSRGFVVTDAGRAFVEGRFGGGRFGEPALAAAQYASDTGAGGWLRGSGDD